MIRKLVISFIAAGAIVGFAWSFLSTDSPKKATLPQAIEDVSPRPGDLDLRQVTLGADLAPGFTGVLLLDGREIPEDDLRRVSALNQVTLQPKADSDYNQLAPGPHRATVLYWKVDQRREAANSYSWHFSLH